MYTGIQKLLVSGAGIGAIEIVPAVIPPSPEEVATVGQLIIQAIVAIFTIIGIFRKKK